MEFNEDGSLKAPPRKHRDHISLFQLISELDFAVGKKLLIKLLRGETNERVRKLRLDKKIHFGNLGGYQEDELDKFIEFLIRKDFLYIYLEKKRYPVVLLTEKGEKELVNREHTYKVDELEIKKEMKITPEKTSYTPSPITEQDKKLFKEFDFFLKKFTDEQKKAIVDTSKKQLCIAGAGSGKTSVLTHKIVFLTKFLGVKPEKILAITFTRKAKQEMKDRLKDLIPDKKITVETFNSYAEKELIRKGNKIYEKEKRMASHKEFLNIVLQAISTIGFDLDTFLEHYFQPRERRGKEQRELFFSFLYDFRAILDTYISVQGEKTSFNKKIKDLKLTEKTTAENILKMCSIVNLELEKQSLRTYSDQLVDLIDLYMRFPESKKEFDWILVDEYQDVNEVQIALLNLLAPKYLFVVGDPRQSIYAWRGSNPNKIYDFIKTNPNKEKNNISEINSSEVTIIELTTNFRSCESVVAASNEIIANSNRGKNSFHPMKAASTQKGMVSIMKFASEDTESIAVVSQIKELACDLSEVFVLSRTNKGLQKIKEWCDQEEISYLLRTDERKDLSTRPEKNQITLSTVHAIKGLEAEMVFVVGSNMNNYPCKAKDHRFVDVLASKEEYDTYEEERRIFYVACTRAKKELRISYSGAPSPFLAKNVTSCATHTGNENQTKLFSNHEVNEDVLETQRSALKRWRYLEAQERGVPAYMIFSDRALENLLELQPLTLEELLDISGLGKIKVKEFGHDILNVMYR